MDALLDVLTGIDGVVLYALIALLVLGESAAIVALVMPGEIALLAAGVLVTSGRLSLPVVLAVTIAAAVAGHAVGYELGRRYGLRLLTWRPLRRAGGAVDGASGLVARRGATAVLLGRWTNLTRIVVPLLAGAARMPYARFTVVNVVGGAAWATAFVVLGAVAGASAEVLERTVGRATWWLTGLVVVGVVARAAWRWRSGRSVPQTARRDGVRADAPPLCTVSAPERRDG